MCDAPNCSSDRTADVVAKCTDTCTVKVNDGELQATLGRSVPGALGLGGGDYVEFAYCLDCGKIQGTFPISHETVRETVEEGYCEVCRGPCQGH